MHLLRKNDRISNEVFISLREVISNNLSAAVPFAVPLPYHPMTQRQTCHIEATENHCM